MDRRFMFMKNMSSGGCLRLLRGYIHVYDHNIQTSLKPLLASQSQSLFGASLGKENES